MAPTTPDDDVLDRPDSDTEKKKKPDLQKPWFNWWSLPAMSMKMVGVVQVSSFNWIKVRGEQPFPSKDVAETAAQKYIDDHIPDGGKCPGCGFTADCYLGAYEEGKSPP